MAEHPTSKHEAALHIIMGELAPLISHAEQIVKMFDVVHDELNHDLSRLGQVVEKTESLNSESKEDMRKLAKYIESKVSQINLSKPTPEIVNAPKVSFWLPCIISALFAASLASGGVYLATNKSIDVNNAKLGEQLQSAWPKLDKATQDKLNAAFAKN